MGFGDSCFSGAEQRTRRLSFQKNICTRCSVLYQALCEPLLNAESHSEKDVTVVQQSACFCLTVSGNAPRLFAHSAKLLIRGILMNTCGKCGQTIAIGSKFCPHCGTPPNSCRKCGAQIADGAKFCPECGASVLAFTREPDAQPPEQSTRTDSRFSLAANERTAQPKSKIIGTPRCVSGIDS